MGMTKGYRIAGTSRSSVRDLVPGSYMRLMDKGLDVWMLSRPVLDDEGKRILVSVPTRSVVEHKDGTISVAQPITMLSPSGKVAWKGFMDCGYWRSVA